MAYTRNAPDAQPRILIVDDDWLNCEVLEAYLESAGYVVLSAHDGARAFAVISETPVDLVLLDVRMPGMDGYEVCAKLKRSPVTRRIPVIMVTALEQEGDKLRAVEAGADGFVTKPFDFPLLLSRIKSLLHIKGDEPGVETAD